MSNPYRALLRTPGAGAFSLAGFVMRMPISMAGIGIVLLISQTTGSYGLAGGVAATYALVQAVAQPQLGRLADRVGQTRVIVPALLVHGTGTIALVVGAVRDASPWVLFLAAAFAGAAFVPVGSLVRARWAHVLGDSGLLQTAYAFESVVDELIFIIGPVLVTLLATRVSPVLGPVFAVGFLLIGTLALAAQRGSEPPRRAVGAAPSAAAIRVAGVRIVTLAFVAIGTIFGAVEVTAVAFTEERGVPDAAALVLALFAGGSLLSGLAYGAVTWRAPLARRFVVAVVALATVAAVFPLLEQVPALAAVAFLGGFAISPTIIAGYALIEALVEPRSLTEGLAWVSTGIGAGVALGSSAVGQVIDSFGARPAFGVGTAAGVAAVAVVLLGVRRLRGPAPAARTAVAVSEP